MLLYYITLVVSFHFVFTYERVNNFNEDYCWRDYVGVIPKDGFVGGLDKRGKPIYIGQVLHENKLIPGQIFVEDDNVHFEWNAKANIKRVNAKIMCTERPDTFEWLNTRNEDVHNLARNKTLVHGGYEENYFTYIGRAVTDGVTNVGKVMCGIDTCLGLYTTHNEEMVQHRVYQILAYNLKPLLDVRVDPI